MRRHHHKKNVNLYSLSLKTVLGAVVDDLSVKWYSVGVTNSSDIRLMDIVANLTIDYTESSALPYTTSSGNSTFVENQTYNFTKTSTILTLNGYDCGNIPNNVQYSFIHNTAMFNLSSVSNIANTNVYRLCGMLNSNNLGIVSGTGSYAEGTVVVISATDGTNYVFDKWSDGNTNRTRNVTIGDSDVTYYAIYKPKQVTISSTVSPANTGLVTGNRTVAYGTSVYLLPAPVANYHFTNWSNASTSATSPLIVKATSDATYTANFAIDTYSITITINNASYGTMSMTYGGNTYSTTSTSTTLTKSVNLGTSVTIKYTPADSACTFVQWASAPSGTPTTFPFNVTVNSNVTYSMTAKRNTQYSICAYTATGDATGTTTVNGNTACSYLNEGSTARFEATPASGYTFVKWSDGNTNNPRRETVTTNLSLYAIYAQVSPVFDLAYTTSSISNRIDNTPFYTACATTATSPKTTGFIVNSPNDVNIQRSTLKITTGLTPTSSAQTAGNDRGFVSASSSTLKPISYKPLTGTGNFTISLGIKTPSHLPYKWGDSSQRIVLNNNIRSNMIIANNNDTGGYGSRWFVGINTEWDTNSSAENERYPWFMFGVYNGSSWQYVFVPYKIQTDTYYHVAFVKSGTTMQCYVNGVAQKLFVQSTLDGTQRTFLPTNTSISVNTINMCSNTSTSPFYIGLWKYWGTQCADNYLITELSMYNNSLTPDVIKGLGCGCYPTSYPS